MTDITLKTDEGYFIYKVGAIIIRDSQVLMIKNDNFPYYYSIGGRVKFGETSENAVLREIYEETNLRLEIDRLAFIHENCFVAGFMSDAACHEIALYYLIKQSESVSDAKCSSVGADGAKESLHWLPLAELSGFQLFPEFYKTELPCLEDGVRHFITERNKTYRVK